MIICLEGINGSGKTSLAQILMDSWLAAGGRTAVKAEPVQSTAFGRDVRTAIMETGDLNPEAEALAFASARLHAADAIDPAAEDLVVLERWAGAVVAYGTVAGTDSLLLSALESVLSASVAIDRTVVVDVPGLVAAERLATQSDTNRFETMGADYLEQVRQSYLDWGRNHECVVVPGTLPHNDAQAWATELVSSLLASARQHIASMTHHVRDTTYAGSERQQ
ncbi:dTMP kinase [Streptomyces sp. NPDC091972]|uniref:dTMP kinase n=1 Tax=Streptomyces sp. NPDC091972 TaxID=3366007 RepID=UPI0037F549AC